MISYSSPDGLQVETVRVAVTGLGLRATGYLCAARTPAYGASYSITVDAQGRSRRITVRCDDADGERSLSLTRSPDGPWISETVAGTVQHPDLVDALDVYLDGSPFTASLPVRRTGLQAEVGRHSETTVAQITLPDLTISPVVHRGSTIEVTDAGARIDYLGSYGAHVVEVDPDGIFIRAEGLRDRIG